MAWLDLDLDLVEEGKVRVCAKGSGGEQPPPQILAPLPDRDALDTFSRNVARAAARGKPLDADLLQRAQALHRALFKDGIRDALVRLGVAAKGDPVLIRLFLKSPALRAIPWEALCAPDTDRGFLGTDPGTLFARGVYADKPWEPREVEGAVRVLAIAPGIDAGAIPLRVLHEALRDAIDAGEVEWLEPIAGPEIRAGALFERLRRGKAPHVVHWLGHGGLDPLNRPKLRLADDPESAAPEGQVWVLAEDIARELSASFKQELRLVVLEACEGAAPGALGSAAEVFSQAGAGAVVAHLWPVKADAARACSTVFYRALTVATLAQGDVATSLAAARRTLLVDRESAEAFSPILFLRQPASVLFDFARRQVQRVQRVQTPGPKRAGRTLAPALEEALNAPFTLVLGDLDEDRAALRHHLEQVMRESGEAVPPGLSLAALTQRYVLLRAGGREALGDLFQEAMNAPERAAPPLIRALARVVRPGVHFTLLWRPHLEHALAESHPERTVYAIQPGSSANAPPRVVKRAAGETTWKREQKLPNRFELDKELVVLRLHGGYSAEAVPILSKPAVTEDDHLQGVEADPAPRWMQELLARPRIQPSLFTGLSVLEWRHRLLLTWLYDKRPAPAGSLALVRPAADAREPAMWHSGGGLPGSSSIAAVQEDPAALASLLDAHLPGGAS